MNSPIQVAKSITYEKGSVKSESYSFFISGTWIDPVSKEEVSALIQMLQQAMGKEVADGKE